MTTLFSDLRPEGKANLDGWMKYDGSISLGMLNGAVARRELGVDEVDVDAMPPGKIQLIMRDAHEQTLLYLSKLLMEGKVKVRMAINRPRPKTEQEKCENRGGDNLDYTSDLIEVRAYEKSEQAERMYEDILEEWNLQTDEDLSSFEFGCVEICPVENEWPKVVDSSDNS